MSFQIAISDIYCISFQNETRIRYQRRFYIKSSLPVRIIPFVPALDSCTWNGSEIGTFNLVQLSSSHLFFSSSLLRCCFVVWFISGCRIRQLVFTVSVCIKKSFKKNEMASVLCPEIPSPGFSFDNCARNAELLKKGFALPKVTKTGTTIAGIVFKDGVVLGADTRATEGSTVSDKNCEKIHYITNNIYCCGAGTAADTEFTTQMISSKLELHKLYTNRVVRVATANQLLKQYLFRYQGYIGAALVLGGVDNTGPHLYCIFPHGSSDSLPYVTMGSGSLAAMAVFEARYKSDMDEKEAVKLVRDAIAAGIFNDLGSGSNVDICVIRKGSVDYLRTFDEANKKGIRQNSYRFPKGTTPVLSTKTLNLDIETTVQPIGESMDTSS